MTRLRILILAVAALGATTSLAGETLDRVTENGPWW
jgi:hypothetical protein